MYSYYYSNTITVLNLLLVKIKYSRLTDNNVNSIMFLSFVYSELAMFHSCLILSFVKDTIKLLESLL